MPWSSASSTRITRRPAGDRPAAGVGWPTAVDTPPPASRLRRRRSVAADAAGAARRSTDRSAVAERSAGRVARSAADQPDAVVRAIPTASSRCRAVSRFQLATVDRRHGDSQLAPLCRITLVAASRTAQPNTGDAAGGSGGPSWRTPHGDAGVGQGRPDAVQLAAKLRRPVPVDRLAYLRQRLPADRLDVGGRRGGQRRVALDQAPYHLGLHHDQRQRVAEQVVQVAGEAQPLLGDRGLRELGARVAQDAGCTAASA